jgi:hypothetical protein
MMKSAYELAMSRLEKTSPAAHLTDDQKARLAAVDREIDAKIAEKKIFLEDQLAKAQFHEQEEIRRQLASELSRLEDKREREKNTIREESRPTV